MPMTPKASTGKENTKAQIRKAAVLGAASILGVGIALGLCFGRTFPQAFSDGTAAALAGLAGWFTYHTVSRQNNGLILLGMNIAPLMRDNYIPFLPAISILLLANVPIAWIIGLSARVLERHKPDPCLGDPLFDAQIDHPA
jgi:hypothetical protein